jgi:NAD(P)-dependent dehydrogenase (short-subunit alcohol dehydrogenase family)
VQEFKDKVTVITGGGSGIGRSLALTCAREGMDVVVADIEADAAESVAKEVQALGRRAVSVHTDVSERSSMDALAEAAYREFGAVHLLFNNAGVVMHGPIAEMTEADWEWLFSVNFWGILNGVYAFLPRMRAQEGERHIVNTSSLNGVIARDNKHGVYTASKYAVAGMSYVLREELAAEGIGVSILCPSMMATRLTEAGRNRQQRFGGPLQQGPMPIPPRRPPADPDVMAPRILQGVRENRRFIFTHPDTRELAEQYYADMLADYDAAARAEQQGI